MAGHLVQLVEASQLLWVSGQPLPCLGQQPFAGSDRCLEANVRVGLHTERDIALEGVQRDARVFPPGWLGQLEGITTPAKLVIGKVFAIAGQSMPVFWVGLLLILLFTVYLGWLPSAGGIDRLGWQGVIMPAISLGWLLSASHMRIVRSSMLDSLDTDYVKMARVKGMPQRLVIWKHAFKNAAIPVFTLLAVNFAHLISGAVVTETIFACPGIGRLPVDSIFARDHAMVQTVVFSAALVIVVVNLLVDLTYAWIDPRIRVAR